MTISAALSAGLPHAPASNGWWQSLCAAEVGAVLCFDASRLSRNIRDWHHLLELCGLLAARVIDLDGQRTGCCSA
jgi:DNA invertase Pin-like site-specific DNA recombinase